jgi:hypothetical protein
MIMRVMRHPSRRPLYPHRPQRQDDDEAVASDYRDPEH